MALAGVTENHPEPAIRACLAAIEIQRLHQNRYRHCFGDQIRFWEIRIGLT